MGFDSFDAVSKRYSNLLAVGILPIYESESDLTRREPVGIPFIINNIFIALIT